MLVRVCYDIEDLATALVQKRFPLVNGPLQGASLRQHGYVHHCNMSVYALVRQHFIIDEDE